MATIDTTLIEVILFKGKASEVLNPKLILILL